MKTTLIHLDETPSTNTFLKEYAPADDTGLVVATAEYQSRGRGQGTNRWESERGQNLLFSILVFPKGIAASRQYVLSMAGALALKAALDPYTEGISLKWPNDVYWHDRKISGTLIETALAGSTIRRCVFGTGINVNQTRFYSDAPNPVSLHQILGRSVNRDELLQQVLGRFSHYYGMALDGEGARLSALYHEALYRKAGVWPFRDADGVFRATIQGVEPDGRLVLLDTGGRTRRYAFKEVRFLKR